MQKTVCCLFFSKFSGVLFFATQSFNTCTNSFFIGDVYGNYNDYIAFLSMPSNSVLIGVQLDRNPEIHLRYSYLRKTYSASSVFNAFKKYCLGSYASAIIDKYRERGILHTQYAKNKAPDRTYNATPIATRVPGYFMVMAAKQSLSC